MIDFSKQVIIKNVNTLEDRKKVLSGAIKYYIKNGQVVFFLYCSFWEALHFFNFFKRKYKNLVQFYPGHINQLNCVNFLDYCGFLKLLTASNKIPGGSCLFIFDFDILRSSKFFPLYNILFQEGFKLSFTFSSLARPDDLEQFKQIEAIYKLKSSFKIKVNFRIIDRFSLPANSVFFCFNKNVLNKILLNDASYKK